MTSNDDQRRDGTAAAGAGAGAGRRIVAKRVGQENRLLFLPTFFHAYFLPGEARVYHELGKMCPDYQGGYWEYTMLSNGGFYMAPAADRSFLLSCEGNDFKGEVSADAAGIIATLMVLNGLAWETQDSYFTESFYWLRDFALEHQEGGAILRAID